MTAELKPLRGGRHALPARDVQNNTLHDEGFQLLTLPATQTLHVNCVLGANSGEPWSNQSGETQLFKDIYTETSKGGEISSPMCPVPKVTLEGRGQVLRRGACLLPLHWQVSGSMGEVIGLEPVSSSQKSLCPLAPQTARFE